MRPGSDGLFIVQVVVPNFFPLPIIRAHGRRSYSGPLFQRRGNGTSSLADSGVIFCSFVASIMPRTCSDFSPVLPV